MKRFICIIVLFLFSQLSFSQTDVLSTKVSEDNSSVFVSIPYAMIVDEDGSISVPSYLCRSVDGGHYEILNDSVLVYEYTDRDVDFTNHSYTYALYYSALDPLMNAVSVMRLTASKMSETKVRLSWNAPVDNSNVVYEIYRYPYSQREDAELIGSTTSLSFIDNQQQPSSTDKVCYYVKASYNPLEAIENIAIDCISTTSTLSNESIFFCPTAFAPKDGVNEQVRTFKPECHFVRYGSYSMKIYNRWGTLLFETSNPDEGWNGKYEDKYCPVGTYVYKIVFVDDEGMQQEKKGTFMLFD